MISIKISFRNNDVYCLIKFKKIYPSNYAVLFVEPAVYRDIYLQWTYQTSSFFKILLAYAWNQFVSIVKTNYISYRDRSGDLHRDRHVSRRKSENKKGNILTHYITLPVVISIGKVLRFIQHFNIYMVSLLIGI